MERVRLARLVADCFAFERISSMATGWHRRKARLLGKRSSGTVSRGLFSVWRFRVFIRAPDAEPVGLPLHPYWYSENGWLAGGSPVLTVDI